MLVVNIALAWVSIAEKNGSGGRTRREREGKKREESEVERKKARSGELSCSLWYAVLEPLGISFASLAGLLRRRLGILRLPEALLVDIVVVPVANIVFVVFRVVVVVVDVVVVAALVVDVVVVVVAVVVIAVLPAYMV